MPTFPSSMILNDPSFDSRNFNPLRPKVQPGMTFEEHQRIVAAGLKKLKLSAPEVSDLEQLVREAKARMKIVRDYGHIIVNEHNHEAKVVNRAQLHGDLLQRFLGCLNHYQKDELHMLFAIWCTEMLMQELI